MFDDYNLLYLICYVLSTFLYVQNLDINNCSYLLINALHICTVTPFLNINICYLCAYDNNNSEIENNTCL